MSLHDTPPPPERRHDYWSAPQERIIIQAMHWAVVVIVVIAITILGIRGDLDKATIGSLYGIVLGHTGTSAANKLSSRGSDRANS